MVTVDARFSVAEAVAIKDGAITAVGSSTDLLALASSRTVVADLDGRTVLPGFVEPHTHSMQVVAPDTSSMLVGHADLIRQGITTAGMPSVLPDQLEGFEQLAANDLIKLRAHLYLAYNSVCGEPLGDSYLAHPFSRDPDARLAIAGVKIFTDGGVCGGPALSVPYLDSVPEELYNSGWVDNGQLYVTDTEIASVLQDVDAAGGQTVIHAIGDLAIATALSRVDLAGPLTNSRQIHHNSWASLVDPDLLRIYGEQGLIPVVQMMPWARACDPGRTELWQSIVAPEALAVVEDRVAINAVNPGIRWAWHGDAPSVIGEAWVLFDGQSFDDFQSIFNNGPVFVRKNNATEGNGFAVFVELEDGTVEPRAQAVGRASAGVWTHVAATWDGVTLALYIDGVPQGTSDRTGSLSTSTVPAQIGRGESGGTDGPLMFGSIDEFTHFTRPLAPMEIRAIYEAGSSGKCRS